MNAPMKNRMFNTASIIISNNVRCKLLPMLSPRSLNLGIPLKSSGSSESFRVNQRREENIFLSLKYSTHARR